MAKKIILIIVVIIVLLILVLITNLLIFERQASVVSIGEPIEAGSEPHPALLIIDVQEATTGSVSLNKFYVDEADKLIDNINKAARTFTEKRLPVIYIRSEITNPLINFLNSSYAKGSVGCKFDSRLNMISEIEVVKSRNDAFINTSLDKVLTKNQVNELYIAGLDAAYCINITVEAAQNRNYTIRLIKDAILSESKTMRDSMFIEFKKRGVEIMHTDSLKLSDGHESI